MGAISGRTVRETFAGIRDKAEEGILGSGEFSWYSKKAIGVSRTGEYPV